MAAAAATAKSNGDVAVQDRKVHDYDQLVSEHRKAHPPQEFRVGDKRFTVPAPFDWPDELIELQVEVEEKPSPSSVLRFTKAFLGDQYDAYRAAGGTIGHFNSVILPALLEGDDPGESSAS